MQTVLQVIVCSEVSGTAKNVDESREPKCRHMVYVTLHELSFVHIKVLARFSALQLGVLTGLSNLKSLVCQSGREEKSRDRAGSSLQSAVM